MFSSIYRFQIDCGHLLLSIFVCYFYLSFICSGSRAPDTNPTGHLFYRFSWYFGRVYWKHSSESRRTWIYNYLCIYVECFFWGGDPDISEHQWVAKQQERPTIDVKVIRCDNSAQTFSLIHPYNHIKMNRHEKCRFSSCQNINCKLTTDKIFEQKYVYWNKLDLLVP